MKYYIINIIAWICAAAVVVFAVEKSGSIDDKRREVIHVTAQAAAPITQGSTASEIESQPVVDSTADSSSTDADDEMTNSRNPQAVAYNDSASVLITKKAYSDAIPYLKKALEIDTGYARAWYNLGIVYHRTEKMGDAIRSYKQAIALRPFYYKPNYNLATLYMSIGSNDDAITWFKKATEIRKSAESAPAHYNLALVYHRLKNDKQAEKSYLDALRLRPGYTEARYNLALIRMNDGKYAEAASDFEKVASLGMKKSRVFKNLGVCYSKVEQYDKAVGAYEKAIVIEPTDAATYFNLAIANNHLERFDKAAEAYRAAIKYDSSYHEAHYNLALLFEKANQPDSALRHYRAAVALKPNYSKAYFSLAQLYYDRQRFDSAEIAYRNVVELDPENLKALFNLALCSSKQDKSEDAAAAYHTLLDQDPVNTKGLNNLGTTYLKLEEYDSAAVYLTRLIGLTHSPESYFNRAKAFSELNRIDDARADLREAIKRDPTYAKAYHNLAILEEKSGSLTEAVQLLQKAIENDSDNWKSYWKLGQIYLKLDLKDKAREAYAKAAEAKPESEKFNREYQALMGQ